ncbi:MAG: hypothetical protein O7H41_02755, partial [Planctomycetota bacterium]|nr:hypothetical protein [Planctomycetota bacterium]
MMMMIKMGAFRRAPWIACCLILSLLLGCGGGGGGGGGGAKRYDLVFTTVPPGGTLANASFDVGLAITDPSTGMPASPNPPIDITLDVAAGTGTLSGVLTQVVGGSTISFVGLGYSGIDALEIRAISPNASMDITSGPIPFDIDIQAAPVDLGMVYPGIAIPGVNFDLLDGLGALYPVSGDLAWSLENLTTSMQVQSGIAPFSGSSTAMVTLAPILVEDLYRLTGNLTGSSNQATADLQISSVGLTFTALPLSGTLVNSLFDVEVTVEDTMTGAPIVPSPPFDITLDVAAGAGTLSGVLTLAATTPVTTFTGLSYSTTDSLELRSQSPRTATVLAGPIPFEVDIQANPASLGAVRPGDPIPAVLFTLFDGLGAQYASLGDLDWTLTDLTAPAVVQSGTDSFGGTAIAPVVLSPITVQGPDQLEAILVGSGNLASVDLSISSIRLTFTSLPPAGTL